MSNQSILTAPPAFQDERTLPVQSVSGSRSRAVLVTREMANIYCKESVFESSSQLNSIPLFAYFHASALRQPLVTACQIYVSQRYIPARVPSTFREANVAYTILTHIPLHMSV